MFIFKKKVQIYLKKNCQIYTKIIRNTPPNSNKLTKQIKKPVNFTQKILTL